MWIIYAIFSAVFAALVALFGKIGLAAVDSTLATTVRAIIMAVFLVGVAIIFGKLSGASLAAIPSRALFFIMASGIAGALSWLFYFIALQAGPASAVAALDRLSVVFVVILAALFLGETLTLRTSLGVLLIIAGATLFVIKEEVFVKAITAIFR